MVSFPQPPDSELVDSDGFPLVLVTKTWPLFYAGTIFKTSTAILGFLSEPLDIDDCVDHSKCSRLRLRAVHRIREEIRTYPSDPLWVWGADEWEWLEDVSHVPCGTEENAPKSKAGSLQEFGDKLPGDKLPAIYDLPS
ncbi:hypothetical protein DFH07DRAFT_940004 [Mycena maculata]|uniref:Uncharacterized protein n=1 Tax=Mycena maculata TaxID=230809 RepID=A0AAD7JB33_9AGAR|nr:hypothetical protein DFH07DRAFT_940004 [Mycena maculata]